MSDPQVIAATVRKAVRAEITQRCTSMQQLREALSSWEQLGWQVPMGRGSERRRSMSSSLRCCCRSSWEGWSSQMKGWNCRGFERRWSMLVVRRTPTKFPQPLDIRGGYVYMGAMMQEYDVRPTSAREALSWHFQGGMCQTCCWWWNGDTAHTGARENWTQKGADPKSVANGGGSFDGQLPLWSLWPPKVLVQARGNGKGKAQGLCNAGSRTEDEDRRQDEVDLQEKKSYESQKEETHDDAWWLILRLW